MKFDNFKLNKYLFSCPPDKLSKGEITFTFIYAL